jgi:hypothetical protein
MKQMEENVKICEWKCEMIMSVFATIYIWKNKFIRGLIINKILCRYVHIIFIFIVSFQY